MTFEVQDCGKGGTEIFDELHHVGLIDVILFNVSVYVSYDQDTIDLEVAASG